MALGFNGHLSSLQDYDLYNYLREKHELTVIGLLLGISAAKYVVLKYHHVNFVRKGLYKFQYTNQTD